MTLECSTENSRDYYGIGVRIGIYCVWLASYLANNFLPSEIAGALDTNTIFMVSLLASIFHGTFTETLVDTDALVLMHLSGGFLFGVLSIWGYRTLYHIREGPRAIRHFGRFGTHCRLTLSMAISAYGLWFWYDGIKPSSSLIKGVDMVDHQDCPPLTTFFFAKLRVNGGIRIFYLIICIGCSIYFGGMVFAAISVSSTRLVRQFGWVKAEDGNKKMTAMRETGLTRKELHQVYRIQRIYNLIWLVYSAIMVECTVIFNHIFPAFTNLGLVASPSQLLPMLIGTFSFIRICYLIYIDRRNPNVGPAHGEEEDEDDDDDDINNDDNQYEPQAELAGQTYAFGPGPHGTRRPPPVHRPTYQRYIVAWLPWLSQTDWWTDPAIRQRRAWDAEHAPTITTAAAAASAPEQHRVSFEKEKEMARAHVVGPAEDVRELKGRERVVTGRF